MYSYIRYTISSEFLHNSIEVYKLIDSLPHLEHLSNTHTINIISLFPVTSSYPLVYYESTSSYLFLNKVLAYSLPKQLPNHLPKPQPPNKLTPPTFYRNTHLCKNSSSTSLAAAPRPPILIALLGPNSPRTKANAGQLGSRRPRPHAPRARPGRDADITPANDEANRGPGETRRPIVDHRGRDREAQGRPRPQPAAAFSFRPRASSSPRGRRANAPVIYARGWALVGLAVGLSGPLARCLRAQRFLRGNSAAFVSLPRRGGGLAR